LLLDVSLAMFQESLTINVIAFSLPIRC
jgi:hypothetical protein